ncbi:MAG: CoxG family protein [Cypionkella sp.]
MKLDGMMPTTCPPEKVVELLSDPWALSKIMPDGCVIGAKVDDTIFFTLQRKVGPINLKMAGDMTVVKKPDSDGYEMELKAAHLIAGRASVTLDLTAQEVPSGQKSLNWTGALEAHGLASRLIEERGEQVGTILANLFDRLRVLAEAETAV